MTVPAKIASDNSHISARGFARQRGHEAGCKARRAAPQCALRSRTSTWLVGSGKRAGRRGVWSCLVIGLGLFILSDAGLNFYDRRDVNFFRWRGAPAELNMLARRPSRLGAARGPRFHVFGERAAESAFRGRSPARTAGVIRERTLDDRSRRGSMGHGARCCSTRYPFHHSQPLDRHS